MASCLYLFLEMPLPPVPPPSDPTNEYLWELMQRKIDALKDLAFNQNPWDNTNVKDIAQPICRFEVGSYFGAGSGRFIYLLTPETLKELPNGTEVTGIFGDVKVKGRDYLDTDTRAGFTSWGIPEEDFA